MKLPKWLFWKIRLRLTNKMWKFQKKRDFFVVFVGINIHKGDEYGKNINLLFIELAIVNFEIGLIVDTNKITTNVGATQWTSYLNQSQ
jgi:hypothetical protein